MEPHILDKLLLFRRDLHQHPELGYQEHRTTRQIAAALQELGMNHVCGPANMRTGVLATITKGEGPTVVLRADIDALPIQEATGLPFASVNADTMHACGHDVHTTMLLGAAQLLQDADFSGTVKLVFQPSEEGVYDDPEKKSGGRRIVEAGIVDDAVAAVALHVHPLLPAGQISYTMGQVLACASFFSIEVAGKAGHAGAAAYLATDAILIASHVVQAVQSVVSRNISPIEPAVISITTIHGGINENVIADKVVLKGTIRALNIDTYHHIVARLHTIMAGVASTFATNISISFSAECPSVLNNAAVHEQLWQPLNDVFGPGNVVAAPPMLAGEDFAFYSRKVPSMFYFIGARDTTEPVFFVHHPQVVMNEACIPLGAQFLARAAVRLLGGVV